MYNYNAINEVHLEVTQGEGLPGLRREWENMATEILPWSRPLPSLLDQDLDHQDLQGSVLPGLPDPGRRDRSGSGLQGVPLNNKNTVACHIVSNTVKNFIISFTRNSLSSFLRGSTRK